MCAAFELTATGCRSLRKRVHSINRRNLSALKAAARAGLAVAVNREMLAQH